MDIYEMRRKQLKEGIRVFWIFSAVWMITVLGLCSLALLVVCHFIHKFW